MSHLLQAILPVFCLLAVGFIACHIGWLKDEYSEGLNRFVYYLAFPALLFDVVARTPKERIFDFEFLGAWTAAVLIGYLLAGVISLIWLKDGIGHASVRAMNSTLGNTSMIGIPLCTALFGSDAGVTAVLVTISNAIVGISITILLICASRNNGENLFKSLANIGLSLINNPLIIGFILGLLCSFFYGSPPQIIDQASSILSGAAIPCSLIATGLFFAGQKQKIEPAKNSIFSIIKLFFQPLAAWFVAIYIFELDNLSTAVLVTLSALPPASTCFVVSQQYKVLPEETSSMTILSTAVSVVTLSGILSLVV